MRRILVPRNPGILCAMGLLLTDLRADFAVTRLTVVGAEAVGGIEAAFHGLSERADEWFAGEAVPAGSRQLTRTVDMRYAGQNYELAVALPDGPVTQATLDALVEGFEAAHKRMYGFIAEGEAIQIVTFRVEATGLVAKASFKPRPDAGPDASGAIIGKRDVWLPEANGMVSCPIYDRSKLDAGNRIVGPAIVEQMDATTVILPGMVAHVEPYLNLVLESL
jgi:N-methylhydantoinase A